METQTQPQHENTQTQTQTQPHYNPNSKIGIIYEMAFKQNKSIEEIIEIVKQPRKVVTNQIAEIRRTLNLNRDPALYKQNPATPKQQTPIYSYNPIQETQTPKTEIKTEQTTLNPIIETPQAYKTQETQETQETQKPAEIPANDLIRGNIRSMAYLMSQYIPNDTMVYYPRKYYNGRNNKLTDQDLYLKVFLDNRRKYEERQNGRNTKAIQNIQVVGGTATGKTTGFKFLGYKHKIPFYNCQIDSTTDPSTLLGGYIPDGKGGLIWIDGVLTRFVRNGGIFVFDEINTANPEVLTALNMITSDLRQIELREKNGEIVKAHKDLLIVCCLNPVSYGNGRSKIGFDLNRRFTIKLFFDYDPNTEKKFIKNPHILNLAQKLRTAEQNGKINTPTDPATLSSLEENIDLLGFQIARDIFLNGYEEIERDAIKEYLKTFNDIGTGTDADSEELKEND